jgi:hypothetical protein
LLPLSTNDSIKSRRNWQRCEPIRDLVTKSALAPAADYNFLAGLRLRWAKSSAGCNTGRLDFTGIAHMSGIKQDGVKLSSVAGKGPGKGAHNVRFSARFHNVQEKARLRLMDVLARMFDQADDALFEMADRAPSNHDQNIYFESMRELRIKRRGMEMEFIQLYDAGFHKIESATRIATEVDAETALLSLVNDSQIEEILAVEGMVTRSMTNCADELSLLSMRFDSLLSMVQISNGNNPVAPQPICEAFAQACSKLDVDIKARLLVLKLFEKFVVRELPKLYQTLNRDLAEEGVLPNISLADRVRRNSSSVKDPSPETMADKPNHSSACGSNNDGVFSELQNLLQSAGEIYARRSAGAGSLGSAGAVGAGSVKIVRRAMVLDLLTNLQCHLPGARTDDTGYLEDMPERQDIRQIIEEILHQNPEGGRYALGEVDEDAINIVSLLFQFVLEDDNLAAPLKSLLSQLQVPMAKVALIDKSFFGKNSHPARKLLNQLAQAGIGWAPAGSADRDFLYRKFKQSVETILTTFDDDIGIFQSVLADFMSFMETERRRANIVEQRTLDTAKGRARAEFAQTTVDTTILACTSGKSLPGVVSELLQHAWSKVLFLIYAREGECSSSWKSACRVMDELIWSVQDKSTEPERQRLNKLKPGLFKSIRSGLGRVGFSHFAMNHFFEQLESIYSCLLEQPCPQAGQGSSAAAETATSPAAGTTLDEMLSSSGAHVESRAPQSVSESPSIVGGGGTAANNEDMLDAVDAGMLSAVDNLAMGSWVQFNQGDAASFRCRLAAVLKPSGKYIFVNRSGKKVAEWSRQQLASNIAKDIVMLLDDRQLFDRALESVISQLQRGRQASSE